MEIDKRYYVNVHDLMKKMYPMPSLKKRIFVTDQEWLQLIGVDVGRCQ